MAARPSTAGAWAPRPASLLATAIVFVPLLSFAMNVLAWMGHGVDMPYMDDWRAYQTGKAGSFDLAYLFKPSNDTLYPVGLFLDSLAQRVLGGNSVAYQLISLTVVLGSLLLLQWRLLRSVLPDRLLAACAFSATLFMLQPNSYWGLQDMAYHQAVPLVMVLFALHVVLVDRWHAWLSPALLLASGAIAGLIYISGAFAILATGVALMLAALLLRGQATPPLARGGLWLTVVGMATSLPQLWVIVIFQKGTHRADAPMAWPTDADFWFYLLGKIGRSLMLPMANARLSLLIVAVACAALLAALGWSLHAARRGGAAAGPATGASIGGPSTAIAARAFVILFALCAAIGVYLALVAAGRTNLRPESMGLLETFSFAAHRFHFFWVTLLWPWLFAVGLLALHRLRPALARPLGVAAAIMTMLFCLSAGAFAHRAFYASAADLRITGIKCIRERMEQGKPIACDSLLPTDLTDALQYATHIDASFARTLDFTEVSELPINPDGNVALALAAGDGISGDFISPRGGALAAIGLLVGNYGGTADGTLTMEVCSTQGCVRSSRKVIDSVDNDFFLLDFAQPLRVARDEKLTFNASVSGSSLPLAAWLYPAVQGSAALGGVRRGATLTPLPGKTLRLALHYLTAPEAGAAGK